ncbi:MAG TPA: ATP-binding protein [Dehalococcoidia bacterium]
MRPRLSTPAGSSSAASARWTSLVIEDLGVRRLPPNAAEDLLEVFTGRYEQGAIILTANRPLEDWGQVLGDTAVAGAILDRIPPPHRDHPTAGKELPHVRPPAARWEPALTGLDQGGQVSYL